MMDSDADAETNARPRSQAGSWTQPKFPFLLCIIIGQKLNKVNRGNFGHRTIPVSIAQKLSLHRAMRI